MQKTILYNNVPILVEYDTRGNMIYNKTPDGYECWVEYDYDKHSEHYRNSLGFEMTFCYDKNGKLIRIIR